VETSRHAVEAGHSTGGERGAASPFGFDAAELLRGRSAAAALHVPGPNFDDMGRSSKTPKGCLLQLWCILSTGPLFWASEPVSDACLSTLVFFKKKIDNLDIKLFRQNLDINI
jgi:hypothetical protein